MGGNGLMGSVCSMVFQGNGLMGSASVIGENQTLVLCLDAVQT